MLNVNKTYSNLCSVNENNEFCCIDGTTGFSNRRLKTMTLNACRMYTRNFQYTCTRIFKLHSLQHRFHKNMYVFFLIHVKWRPCPHKTLSIDTKFKTSGVEAIEVGTLACVVSKATGRYFVF